MEKSIRDFKDLFVWQKACDLSILVYKTTKGFPKSETYGLTSQIRRASVSIASNIAEGYCRHYTNEFIQFLYMSLGSTAELETQLIIVSRLEYITAMEFEALIIKLHEIRKMLNALINSLKRKIKT